MRAEILLVSCSCTFSISLSEETGFGDRIMRLGSIITNSDDVFRLSDDPSDSKKELGLSFDSAEARKDGVI